MQNPPYPLIMSLRDCVYISTFQLQKIISAHWVTCPSAYKIFTLHVTTQVAAIQAITCITIHISYITHGKVKYSDRKGGYSLNNLPAFVSET